MPKIKYLDKKISEERLKVIAVANAIIQEFALQGFTLTLRQLYYQFVARDYIPNTQKHYKWLGDVINDGRLVGLIDWLAIIDRTRNLMSVRHWTSPTSAVSSMADSFRIDKWADQPYRPEVWIEKDAIVGVVEGVCSELDVPYFSCRGYTSQSEMWVGAQRLKKIMKKGQIPLILHMGDHDPSGKDMTRDIKKRLELFIGHEIQMKRLALTFKQVEKYHPPPNPTKIKDPRAKDYIKKFGMVSWELDAMQPAMLARRIRRNVEAVRDEAKWDAKVAEEHRHRQLLQETSDRWPEVVNFLGN